MPRKVPPTNRSVSHRLPPLLSLVTIGVLVTACGGNGSNDAAMAEQIARLGEQSSNYAGQTATALRSNDAAIALGGELFEAHCAGCHGSDGRGSRGVTDLSLGRFGYGSTADSIRTTIRDGRSSEMPGMGREYGEVELGQIVAYIETLATGAELNEYEAQGSRFYAESCASCHGDDGAGIPELGASDLTDEYWQHGDSMMQIRLAITRGVTAECPAPGATLSAAEIELLTAHVMNLAGI